MGFLDRLLKRPPAAARKLSRNAPCWCGSGKKYKKCHLQADSSYFARVDAAAQSCGSYG